MADGITAPGPSWTARFRDDMALIVDSTLVAHRGHTVAERSKNDR